MESPIFPSGNLTFLFSDIQGSTPLWESDPIGMSHALELHNAALHGAIKLFNGRVFKIIGDEFQAVFAQPVDAIQAAVAGQRALGQTAWEHVGPLRVRMGIHTGPAQWEGHDYAVSHSYQNRPHLSSVVGRSCRRWAGFSPRRARGW